MAERDRLQDAVRKLDVDPLDGARERVREASERATSAPEKRGIAALIARVVAWLARLKP